MPQGSKAEMTAKPFLKRFNRLPIIIAEAGVNHNGSVELARRLVDAAAAAGADIIKFQTFKAWECTGRYAATAPYQQKLSASDQYQILKNLELDFADFGDLKDYAEQCGLVFLSTPDGQQSLNLLCNIGSTAIKVGSGELTNLPFLNSIGCKKCPVILSTGMGTLGEVQKAIEALADTGAPEIILLHCTTEYPAPAEETNLRAITTMQQAFGLPVGFSDHTTGNEAAIAATALGAIIIEKHLTLDRGMPGPDHAASMEPHEFTAMVKSLRRAAEMMGNGIKCPTRSEAGNMPLVRRGLVAARDLRAGETLTGSKVAIKRPAAGITPELLPQAINRRITRDIAADEPLTWSDLGEVTDLES